MYTFKTFPNQVQSPGISRAEGPYLYLEDGNKYLDLTAGTTGFAILGGGVEAVALAVFEQLRKYPHSDYKYFQDEGREYLSEVLVGDAPGGLDKVLFSGGSGAEACEMALLLSYQVHVEQKRPKKSWAIATQQSYHGVTAGALAVGERPNLEFYGPLLPQNRLRIPECNFLKHARDGESPEAYALRSANALESAILSVGPERVGCFVAETMLGGLVGDVPAAPGYWRRVREICDLYDVHLILDEVWCGGGVTGKFYCFEWEQISPDFVLLGKTLAAGYAPISVVLTKSCFEETIKTGSGRLEASSTFQGHSGSCAAAIAVQAIVRTPDMMSHVEEVGALTRRFLESELGNHEFYRQVRGRGIRNSLEYICPGQNLFGQQVASELKVKYGIMVSGKWHRISFTHSMLLDWGELEPALARATDCFRVVASRWTTKYISGLVSTHFF